MHNLVLATQSNDPKIKAAQNDSYNALARMYQQTGQLELAARQYQNYAVANPKDPKAINAYFNAGVLWESLGESNEAVKSYEAYMEKSQKSDRNEVLFNEAEMFYKQGKYTKALNYYTKYLDQPRSRAHSIQSTFMIGQIYKKQGKATLAQKQDEKTVYMYKNSDKGARDEVAKYAAEARFNLAQPTLQELMNIRFGTAEKTQAKMAQELLRLKEKYIGEMKEVIRYDNSTYIVAALASGGKMFEAMANNVEKIQIPKTFNAEEAKKYKELLTQQVNGFRNEAKNSYKAAVDKAQALEEYSDWTKVALAGLASVEQMTAPAPAAPAAPADGTAAGSAPAPAAPALPATIEQASDTKTPDWMGL